MQGLADGYFVIPSTIAGHFAGRKLDPVDTSHPAFGEVERSVEERTQKLLGIQGRRSADDFHRELGQILWDHCGMARNDAGLRQAIQSITELRSRFWEDLRVPGSGAAFNQTLEHAGRVADFMEFAELMVSDALNRAESCGGHFREESQTEEGEARRDDDNFCYGAAWEFNGVGEDATLHKESLEFEHVKLTQRSYK